MSCLLYFSYCVLLLLLFFKQSNNDKVTIIIIEKTGTYSYTHGTEHYLNDQFYPNKVSVIVVVVGLSFLFRRIFLHTFNSSTVFSPNFAHTGTGRARFTLPAQHQAVVSIVERMNGGNDDGDDVERKKNSDSIVPVSLSVVK